MNVFTYGSLMFPEVWTRVTGSQDAGIPATLAGYTARRIRGQSYPALVPDPAPAALTQGILYRNVSPEALRRLDLFEGDFYVRKAVPVTPAAPPETTDAWVYAAAEPAHPDILPDLWDTEQFRQDSLQDFLSSDPGFSGPR